MPNYNLLVSVNIVLIIECMYSLKSDQTTGEEVMEAASRGLHQWIGTLSRTGMHSRGRSVMRCCMSASMPTVLLFLFVRDNVVSCDSYD